MLILAIETSCDETAVALLIHDRVVGEIVYSQHQHSAYGGVVPELAAREHQTRLPCMVRDVLLHSGYHFSDITEIAYTHGPGLIGCLLIAHYYVLGLALGLGIPLRPIHHLEGHMMSVLTLGEGLWSERYTSIMPCMVLIVSGGHTQFVEMMKDRYTIVGDTVDDAVGEVFDKIARLMDCPYPGAAQLSAYAAHGEPLYPLPRPMIDRDNGVMSFSGLKTAARTLWQRLMTEHIEASDDLKKKIRSDFAASFEYAIIDTLMHKIHYIMTHSTLRRLVIVGGVSANRYLRARLDGWSVTSGVECLYPPLRYCTDNAVMIGIAAAVRHVVGAPYDEASVNVHAALLAPGEHISSTEA